MTCAVRPMFRTDGSVQGVCDLLKMVKTEKEVVVEEKRTLLQ